MKFPDYISFQNITVAKFQCPKFTKRAITQKCDFFSPNIPLHPLFSKGLNFTRGDNSGKK